MKMLIVSIALLQIVLIAGEPVTPIDKERQAYICANSVLDLVFVLDSSASIWEPDFYKQIKFVENIVKQFEIGPAYTQVGAVTFGQTYWHKFHLNTHKNKKSLLKAINRIRYRPGSYTNTGAAIEYMNSTMFSPRHGDRFLSRNIAVVITDGRSQETNKTKEMAAAAHRAGITIFAIGVGNRVSQEELKNIASDPDWEHVFEVDNYNALDSIKDTLTSRTCYELTTVGPPTPKPTSPSPVETWEENRQTIIRTEKWNRTIETSWTNEEERLRLLEEKRLRELEELRKRAALEEEQRRLRELEAEQQRLRELEAEKLRLRELEAERQRLKDLEAEQDRLRKLEEERRRQEEQRLRELEEQQRRFREQEEESRRKALEEEQRRLRDFEADRLRREQEAELLRLQQEAERLRREKEAERLRRQEEEERRRKILDEMRRRELEFGNANRNRNDWFGLFNRRGDDHMALTSSNTPGMTFLLPDDAKGVDLHKLFGRCNDKPADIYFVMDASSSIGRQNYKKQKRFIVNLVRQFDIGADKTRVGVISFSNSFKVAVPLGSANDIRSLSRAIHNVPYTRGGTHTAAALKYVKDFGFSGSNSRKDAAQIVIVLTDGYSRDPLSTEHESKNLHNAGISTFVIGIGDGIDMAELKGIASDPDNTHLFQVDDFNALDTIKDLLVSRACETPVNNILVCQSVGPMDIVFMYDTVNLGRQRSDQISNFIFDVVGTFDQQSFNNIMVRRFLDYCPIDGQTNLMSPQDFMRLRGGHVPGVYEILTKYTREVGNNKINTALPVGVVFLDSEIDNMKTILPFIESMTGTNIFTVVIGPEPRYNMAGMRNVLLVPSYEALDDVVRLFVRQFCTMLSGVHFSTASNYFF